MCEAANRLHFVVIDEFVANEPLFANKKKREGRRSDRPTPSPNGFRFELFHSIVAREQSLHSEVRFARSTHWDWGLSDSAVRGTECRLSINPNQLRFRPTPPRKREGRGLSASAHLMSMTPRSISVRNPWTITRCTA